MTFPLLLLLAVFIVVVAVVGGVALLPRLYALKREVEEMRRGTIDNRS